MSDDGLRFEHVGVVAPDGTVVLDDVDLDLPRDGITVILGPSGSGKTSLLRLANRLDVPTTGTVRYRGHDLADLDPLEHRRRVGMVAQRPVVFAGTVRDNLAVALPDGDDERFAGELVRCGLDPALLERVADDLSGGEAQRLCLARTLLTEPELVLADEPTASLDGEHRDAIEELARALRATGVGFVWVTHDREQARRLADRVVCVDGGRASLEARG